MRDDRAGVRGGPGARPQRRRTRRPVRASTRSARRATSSCAGGPESRAGTAAERRPRLADAIPAPFRSAFAISFAHPAMTEASSASARSAAGDMLRSRRHHVRLHAVLLEEAVEDGRSSTAASRRVYPWACMGCGVVLLYLDRLPAVAEEYRTARAAPAASPDGSPAPIKP